LATNAQLLLRHHNTKEPHEFQADSLGTCVSGRK
jgi:hypothetical protein